MNIQTSYAKLLTFLDQHGKSPTENFPQTALELDDARNFLEILLAEGVRPLGIELWRRGENGYRVDGPKGWYAEVGELDPDSMSAKEFLNSDDIGREDLFVFQF